MNRIASTLISASFLACPIEFTYALDDFLDDELPIVISASRLNQSVLTSPSSVSVIDKEMIRASGFIEFADLLRLVPGFQVAHADGRRFAVAYHGLGSDIGNRLQVLVNGRSTYTPSLSTVNWDSLGIQLEDIEKIEVVKGSSASAYGSNSFTAAINIITKAPELDDKLNLSFRIGTHGERNALLRHSDTLGKLHYRVTASTRESDGFDDVDDGKTFKHLGFHGRFNTNNNNPINFYLTYTDGTTDTKENAEQLLERDVEITSWSAHAQGSTILSNDEEITWNIYHNRDDIYDLSPTLLLSDLFGVPPEVFEAFTGNPDTRTIEGSETNDSTKSDIETTYSSSKNQGIQYIIGAGLRYDTLKSPSYFREQGRLSDLTYRVFANSQSPITSTLTFNTGAIYEYTESYKGRTSPRASLNWRLTPNQSVRFAGARGYRFPSVLEKNFDTRTTLPNGFVIDERYNSDENLQPEKINTLDLGYLGKFQHIPISWDIKIYKESINNIINYAEVRETQTILDTESSLATNGRQIKSYGFEGEVNYRPSKSTFLKFHFHHARSKYNELTEIDPLDISERTNSIPKQTYSLLGSTKLMGWQFNAGFYFLGSMRWYNQGGDIESYKRLDMSASKEININNNTLLNLSFAAQNIGGNHTEFGNAFDSDEAFISKPRYYINAELKLL